MLLQDFYKRIEYQQPGWPYKNIADVYVRPMLQEIIKCSDNRDNLVRGVLDGGYLYIWNALHAAHFMVENQIPAATKTRIFITIHYDKKKEKVIIYTGSNTEQTEANLNWILDHPELNRLFDDITVKWGSPR